MNKFILLLLPILLLSTENSFARIVGAPFLPEADQRFDTLERATGATQPTQNGIGVKQIARAQYDFAVQGGASTALSLGVSLPAGAIVVRDYFYIDSAFTSTGAATVALSCETANNLFSAANILSSNGYTAGLAVDGVSTGASTVFKKITSACPITATIGAAPLTAGKLTLWVEYVVHN